MQRLELSHSAFTRLEPPETGALLLSELIGALSHALGLTEGQPKGHCVRCCWIGMHIGRTFGLTAHDQWELYHTLLLKDLGCGSNAARICDLYLADDLAFKRDFKLVGESLPQMLRFVFTHTGVDAGLGQRFGAVMNILQNGPQIACELTETRCQRGSDIARQLLGVSNRVLDKPGKLDANERAAVRRHAGFTHDILARIGPFQELARFSAAHHERLDGNGYPNALEGAAIPLETPIITTADVFDAISANRLCRLAMPVDRTLAIMSHEVGSVLDPLCFDALGRVLHESRPR